MAQRDIPTLLVVLAMFLLTSNHLVLGNFPQSLQSTICPRTLVGVVDILPGTLTSDCGSRGHLTARCAPYCGRQRPNATYVSVVIGRSCTNVKRIAINTASFADATGVQAPPPGLLGGLCKGYRAFVSGRFTIPGANCDIPLYFTDVTASLYDSCNNKVDDCESLRIIQRTSI